MPSGRAAGERLQAWRAGARALVSGDRDLLALAGTPGLSPVLGVDACCRQFLGD
jgi:hypothetical protein